MFESLTITGTLWYQFVDRTSSLTFVSGLYIIIIGSSVELINKLYQNEHKHKVGVDGWTAEQHLAHRKKYALDILGEIKDVLDEIEERGDLLPKSELREPLPIFTMSGMP